MSVSPNKIEIQTGLNTHTHDQSITPVSLSTMNTIVNNELNDDPFDLLFDIVFVFNYSTNIIKRFDTKKLCGNYFAKTLKLLPLFQYNYFKLCTLGRQSLFKVFAILFFYVNPFYYISTVIKA